MNSAVGTFACLEKELLACCARTRVGSAVAQKISELLNDSLDWDYILNEAEENSVTPLLGRNLPTDAGDRIPAAILERLKNACRANTIRCLFLTAELTKILDLFRARGIQAIAYKGPALAVQAYGDVTLRQFEDLDIIIRQSDLQQANEVMVGLGYRPRFEWILSSGRASSLVPGEYNYRDEKRRVMVELHTELTLRHFPKVPDLEDFSKRLIPVKLNDRDVSTFSAEDALIVLSIHGAKDFWERFSWIADISELVQRYPSLDWDATIGRAEALEAERMLHTGLLLATGLLDVGVPDEVRRRLQADQAANEVAGEILSSLMSRAYRPLDAKGRFNFRRRMRRGRLAGFRYAMRLSVIPAEEDYEMIRLPAQLSPLYVALRPLRLLRKYGWSRRNS